MASGGLIFKKIDKKNKSFFLFQNSLRDQTVHWIGVFRSLEPRPKVFNYVEMLLERSKQTK